MSEKTISENKDTEEQAISFYTADIDFNLESELAVAEWLKQVGLEKKRTISNIEYVLCSDEYLLDINQKYLSHDTLTDIITFPLQESPLEATIYISAERVKENAELYKVAFQDELHRVMAHGLLHLLGFKDKTEDEINEMRLQEQAALAKRTFI
jgi:rRNA maturation RNase YbeY